MALKRLFLFFVCLLFLKLRCSSGFRIRTHRFKLDAISKDSNYDCEEILKRHFGRFTTDEKLPFYCRNKKETLPSEYLSQKDIAPPETDSSSILNPPPSYDSPSQKWTSPDDQSQVMKLPLSPLQQMFKTRSMQWKGFDPSKSENFDPSHYDSTGRYVAADSKEPRVLTDEEKKLQELLAPYRAPWLPYPGDKSNDDKPSGENSNSNSEPNKPTYPSFDPYRLVREAEKGNAFLSTTKAS